jgi:hypothetical protein
MSINPLKTVLTRGAEAVASVTMVVLFFLAILFLLGVSFPEGTGLRELMVGGADPAPRTTGGLDFAAPLPSSRGPGGPVIARLSWLNRKVKDKPAGSIAWSSSARGQLLEEQHAVQTFERSGARISFDEGTELQVGQSSLVVLRSLGQDSRGPGRRASLVILGGELRARLGGAGEAPLELEVATAGGTARLRSAGRREGPTDVRVKVNPDRTSTVSVFDGTARVVAGGRNLVVRAHQALTMSEGGRLVGPVALPGAPSPQSPAGGAVLPYRMVPPRTVFSWLPARGSDGHRIEIARDPEFEDPVHDTRLSATEFTHGNLRAGRYYWRVRGVRGWAEGQASPPRRVELIQDAEPPALEVGFPQEAVAVGPLALAGLAEPGCQVFVGDREIPAATDGGFSWVLDLRPGLNVVVVQAIDAAGNVSYRSGLVRAR